MTAVEKIVQNAQKSFLTGTTGRVCVAPRELEHYPFPERIVASLTQTIELGGLFVLIVTNGAALTAPRALSLSKFITTRQPGPNTQAGHPLFLFRPEEMSAVLLNDLLIIKKGYAGPALPCAGRFFSRLCYCVCKKMAL